MGGALKYLLLLAAVGLLSAFAFHVLLARGISGQLAGDFNNHEQVWRFKETNKPVTLPHWRLAVQREGDAFSVRHLGGSFAHLWREPSPLPWGVSMKSASHPACGLRWRPRGLGEGVYAAPVAADCGLFAVSVPGKSHCEVAEVVSEPEFLRFQVACVDGSVISIDARRERKFKGWVVLRKDRLDPDAGPDEFLSASDVVLHNEGQKFYLSDDDGNPTGYGVELARLTHVSSGTAVLKLGVFDGPQGARPYTWTSPGAGRIGINLRWFQAGFTAIP